MSSELPANHTAWPALAVITFHKSQPGRSRTKWVSNVLISIPKGLSDQLSDGGTTLLLAATEQVSKALRRSTKACGGAMNERQVRQFGETTARGGAIDWVQRTYADAGVACAFTTQTSTFDTEDEAQSHLRETCAATMAEYSA
jgi:hypothetical protein